MLSPASGEVSHNGIDPRKKWLSVIFHAKLIPIPAPAPYRERAKVPGWAEERITSRDLGKLSEAGAEAPTSFSKIVEYLVTWSLN